MFAGETDSMSEVKDLPPEKKWPTLYRFRIGSMFSIGIIAIFGWLGYSGIVGILTGNLPWPFALGPVLSYEEYLKNYETTKNIVHPILSLVLAGVGLLFTVRHGYLLIRRLNRRKEVNKQA